MAEIWYGTEEPAPPVITRVGWARVALRGVPIAGLVFGGLAVLLLVRLVERPFYGLQRPITPFITQFVCRGFFLLLGMRHRSIGRPMRGAGAVVANHASWLDIFALNLRKRIYFVSKAEVATWPGIGWLARATGTVFIERQRRDAKAQIALFRERLAAGHKLLFFPEGTSTDGQRVLPFKPTLFAAFFDETLAADLHVQAVSVCYHAPAGADPRFYGWWGDMEFAPNLLGIFAAPRQGGVTVIYHDPVRITDFANRKALAKAMEEAVRSGLAKHGLMQAAQR
ncbi:lysophospholipid acyltransferase family protein [Loktanella agnita]|uniref:lysophospholipid acyltransferase family protein n=1 Tax=Loktanella agnita TaxID=287097 RepID=UPI0039874152